MSVNANVNLSGVTLSDGYPSEASGGATLKQSARSIWKRSESRIMAPAHLALFFRQSVTAVVAIILTGRKMTLTSCSVDGNNSVGSGGGILNSGTLTVTNSTISGNTAGYGGGIYSTGTLTMTNSDDYRKRHVHIWASPVSRWIWRRFACFRNFNFLVSDTISANQAQWRGGGIDGYSSVNMTNCIVAANTVVANPGDISGMVESGGYNLIRGVH